MNARLEIKATLQVLKPSSEVFDAIVDPGKMSHYFISKSNGRLEEGKELLWEFPEMKMQVPIRAGKIEKDKYVSFYWEGSKGKELLVEMTLTAAGSNTIVLVTEKSMENTPEGIEWLGRNTEGWANFLACLKAFLEYGINLRKGAFDFMKK